jgi:uracil-DNA glycosylase
LSAVAGALTPIPEPPCDCALCPRLAEVRAKNALARPEWWNAPVPAFGDPRAWLAIVGLAPGKQGANRTGRPFTGDAAGGMLWTALNVPGLSEGVYAATADDGVTLNGAIILNAVKCFPPGNKPTPDEIRTCRPYLKAALDALPDLTTIIALGTIAHQSVVKANGEKLPKRRFVHGAVHRLLNGRVLIDSYHPSQLNQNTGRITPHLFDEVFAAAVAGQTSSTSRP